MSDPLIGCDPAAAVAVRAISACLCYREWEAAEAGGEGRPTMGPDRAENAKMLASWHCDRCLIATDVNEAMPPYPAGLLAHAGEVAGAMTTGNHYVTPLNWRQFLALCADYVATVAMPPVPAACVACGDPADEKRCGWCGKTLCDICAEASGHLGGPYCCDRDECEARRGRGEVGRFVAAADAAEAMERR